MHASSIIRMKWFVDNYASKISKNKIKVLDVGSYDVNGSYKHLFIDDKYEYVGLDMEKGPNVDIVLENPYNWNEIETDTYDIVISGQAFEHIEFFWITMSEMTRVLKKNGLICIIAPNGFEEHRHPVDCYRFFSDGMVALARYTSLDTLHAHTNCAPSPDSKGWYSKLNADSVLIAQKNYDGETQYVNTKSYVCIPPNQKELRTGLFTYTPEREPSLLYKFARKILHSIKK
jgi:SAM-dependent methyltransferase